MRSVCKLKNSVRRINWISAPLTLTQGGGETIVLYCRSVQDHIPVMERELWHRWYGISICESLNAAGRSLTRRRRPCANKPDLLLSTSSPITLTETFILSILSLRHSFTSFPCGHCWSSAHLRDKHRQVGQLLSSRCQDQMRLFSFAQNNINVMDLGLFDLFLALRHVIAVVNG